MVSLRPLPSPHRETRRSRFEISTFALAGQSLLSSYLATALPVFPLTVATRTQVIAVLLSSALNLEEIPALSIGADFNLTSVKKFPPEYAVKQGPNPEADVRVHFHGVRESKGWEDVHEFANDDSNINFWGPD